MEEGNVGATMIKYFVGEVEGRPRGMNVCGVYGWRSRILTSNNLSSFDARSFRGEDTNMFITGFASFRLGARG